jgi:hypothetical protein
MLCLSTAHPARAPLRWSPSRGPLRCATSQPPRAAAHLAEQHRPTTITLWHSGEFEDINRAAMRRDSGVPPPCDVSREGPTAPSTVPTAKNATRPRPGTECRVELCLAAAGRDPVMSELVPTPAPYAGPEQGTSCRSRRWAQRSCAAPPQRGVHGYLALLLPVSRLRAATALSQSCTGPAMKGSHAGVDTASRRRRSPRVIPDRGTPSG